MEEGRGFFIGMPRPPACSAGARPGRSFLVRKESAEFSLQELIWLPFLEVAAVSGSRATRAPGRLRTKPKPPHSTY